MNAIGNKPLTISTHSATLVDNYMFINFGHIAPFNSPQIQLPFFYILDIRNFTWVTQFEPEQLSQLPNSTNTVNTSNTNSPGKQIGIILGTVSLSVVVGIVVGLLGYKYYKKQRARRYAKQAKHWSKWGDLHEENETEDPFGKENETKLSVSPISVSGEWTLTAFKFAMNPDNTIHKQLRDNEKPSIKQMKEVKIPKEVYYCVVASLENSPRRNSDINTKHDATIMVKQVD
ncbi:hypothetical protein RhiirB3_426708 [Rhizophagus irregularis]|nr:hypothetical protein RhiirB3_426708 [Rhizophagus irregularis]